MREFRLSPLVEAGVRGLKEPAEATRALPGSEEKLRVMEERVARGESCFHRLDWVPKWDGE